MANQTGFRDGVRFGDQALANYQVKFYLKSGETIYADSLVFVDNITGYAYASTGATRVCVGYNDSGTDLVATSDTSTTVTPRKNAYWLTNSSGSALANKDRGKLVYAEDNQTARLASGAYAPLGTFIGIDPDDATRVCVEVGSTPIASIAGFQATTVALTNLSALAGTGFIAQTSGAADNGVFAERSIAVGSASLTVANPAGVAGNPTLDASAGLKTLDSLAGTGIIVQTGGAANNGTYQERTIVAGSTALAVTNGDGVAGNPSIDGSTAVKNLSALAGTGFLAQTGGAADAGTFAERSITSSDSSLSISNPAGIAGNPDIKNLFACIELADPGDGAAIPVTGSATLMLTIGAGAETNTLAIPTFVGQRMVITCGSIAGGTRAITSASAINAAGNTTMTFNAARDNCELRGVKVGGVLAWEIGFNASVALS